MKKYDVNFKIDKIQELWLTLSDKGFLCFDKITNVSVKSKKKQNNEKRLIRLNAFERLVPPLKVIESFQGQR